MTQAYEEEYNKHQQNKEIKSKEIVNNIKVSLRSFGTNLLYNLDELYSVSLSGLIKQNPHKVSFFGKEFGHLNEEEFIYREKGLAKLRDISDRLQKIYWDCKHTPKPLRHWRSISAFTCKKGLLRSAGPIKNSEL